jgi:hypothetical protein
LGFVAEEPSDQDEVRSTPTSLTNSARGNLEAARSYYQAASQRLGRMRHGLVAAQCWHYSGVYQMYKLDPASAWTSFAQASSITYMLLKSKALSQNDGDGDFSLEEQSLYWTCWKSEMYVPAFPTYNFFLDKSD